jgi:uncharacterized protein (DUF952 family)
VRVFHIATAADWASAQRRGAYTTSTRGVTLEHEGFIHAARREQVPEVWKRYYADAGEPLVLLTIDTTRLGDADVRVETVGDDAYPHVYGPIDRRAVIDVTPLNRRGGTETVTSLWIKGMATRMGIALALMVLVAVVVLVARRLV